MPAAKPTRPDATLAALYKAVLAAPDDDLPRATVDATRVAHALGQLNALLDNPEVCKVGRLVLPSRVKVGRATQRRYEKVFGVRITQDW